VVAGLEECQGILLKNVKQPLVPPLPAAPYGGESAENEEDVGYGDIPAAVEDTEPQSPVSSSAVPPLTPPYMLVRVLQDMDKFMGVDGRIYSLAKGDIVTLPERNASVLSDRSIVIGITLP